MTFIPSYTGGKSRNPVRRSNSSPEMSASWKNPFLKEHSKCDEDCAEVVKQKQMYTKVSCEAIPEEIAGLGTTPPESVNQPLLISVSTKPPPHSVPQQSPSQKKSPTIQKLGGVKREGLKLETKPLLDKQMFCLSVDTGGKVVVKAPLSTGELGMFSFSCQMCIAFHWNCF